MFSFSASTKCVCVEERAVQLQVIGDHTGWSHATSAPEHKNNDKGFDSPERGAADVRGHSLTGIITESRNIFFGPRSYILLTAAHLATAGLLQQWCS